MKKLALFAVFLLAVGFASAGSFSLEKYSSITGDWKWEDEQWNYGNWQTGWYGMSVETQDTLHALYTETETLGQPWMYDLESHLGFDGIGTISNDFHVWTVNDPATSPATGIAPDYNPYTQYSYQSHTYADFSQTHLTVSGIGAVNIETNIEAESGVQHYVGVDVN